MLPEGSRERGNPQPSAMQNHIKEETLSIHRDRRNNGNEIGENITTIKTAEVRRKVILGMDSMIC